MGPSTAASMDISSPTGSPFKSTVGPLALLFPRALPFSRPSAFASPSLSSLAVLASLTPSFSVAFSFATISASELPSSSPSSSSSLRSSTASLLVTNRTAILMIRPSQNRFTACRHASSAKVIHWASRHLYCSVSQFSSKGPTVLYSVRIEYRICRLMWWRR